MTGESFYQSNTMLDAMSGKRLDGGCDDCAAYQEVEQVQPGVYSLTVRHDATCPTYRQIVAERGGAR